MSTVRIGVVGCGAIAQVQHLPNLLELDDEFEVPIVCDVSPGQAEYVAQRFKVPKYVTDLRDMLAADIDAVLLCHTDPKTEAAIQAFEAGKHVFIEKPICTSLQEADAMIEAMGKSEKVGQAGYMKVYEPAFEMAKREVDTMDDIKFVQTNHLHPSNELHLSHFKVKRFNDLPPSVMAERHEASRAARREAFGDLFEKAESCGIAYGLIHDLYSLRTMLGMPSAVISTEIWNDRRAITTILEYPNGARCVVSRVDLNRLWDFKQTLEIYSEEKRVILSYPTGFSRRVLTKLVVQGIDADGNSFYKEPAIPWDSGFTRELLHFRECITQGTPSRSSLVDARDDIDLIIDITKAYITRSPVYR